MIIYFTTFVSPCHYIHIPSKKMLAFWRCHTKLFRTIFARAEYMYSANKGDYLYLSQLFNESPLK